MSKYTTSINNFSAGKIGGKSLGLIDIKEYQNGFKDSLNMIPRFNGGIFNRPGTVYWNQLSSVAKGSTADKTFFIPFILNKKAAFNIYIDPDEATVYNQIRAYPMDVVSYPSVNGRNYGTGFPDVDPLGYHYTQVGNFIILVHNSGTVAPKVIQWDSPSTAYDFSCYDYTLPTFDVTAGSGTISPLTIPYLTTNVTATTLTPSATTGNITVAASTAIFDVTNHVGALFRIRHASTDGIVRLKANAGNTTTSFNADVILTLGNTTATDNWAECAWNGVQGYPRTVIGFEQRILLGGTPKKKDTIWGSAIGNIFLLMQEKFIQDASTDVSGYNYFGAQTDLDPFSVTLAAAKANDIAWMAASSVVEIGTVGEEYTMTGGDIALTPLEIPIIKLQSAYGSAPYMPARVGNRTVYISRDGQKLRDFKYVDTNGAFTSNNLNILADDVLEFNSPSGINSAEFVKIVFQASRNIIWCLTDGYELLGCTFQEDGTVAWHEHLISGVSDVSDNTTKIYDISILPNENGTFDNVMLYTQRYINSSTEYFSEYIGPDFNKDDLAVAAVTSFNDWPFLLDLADIHAAAQVITGLTYIEGEEISVIADGDYLGEFTVDGSGEIDLGIVPTLYVITGYKYSKSVTTTPLEVNAEFGSALGLYKRTDRAYIKFYRTRNASLQSNKGAKYAIPFEDTTELFTGGKREMIEHSPDSEFTLTISQDDPYPLGILAIALRGVTYD